jgi:hypothetical protein
MKSKFVIIIGLIGILIIGILIGNNIHQKRNIVTTTVLPKEISDDIPSKKSQTPVTNADIAKIQGFNPGFCENKPVIDKNDVRVENSRNIIISKTKMSKQYVQKHFEYICGDSTDSMMFKYSIGEYTTHAFIVSESILFRNASEIENVISKESAIEKMNQCLGAGWKSSENSIYLTSEGLIFEASKNYWMASIDLETGVCNKANMEHAAE